MRCGNKIEMKEREGIKISTEEKKKINIEKNITYWEKRNNRYMNYKPTRSE